MARALGRRTVSAHERGGVIEGGGTLAIGNAISSGLQGTQRILGQIAQQEISKQNREKAKKEAEQEAEQRKKDAERQKVEDITGGDAYIGDVNDAAQQALEQARNEHAASDPDYAAKVKQAVQEALDPLDVPNGLSPVATARLRNVRQEVLGRIPARLSVDIDAARVRKMNDSIDAATRRAALAVTQGASIDAEISGVTSLASALVDSSKTLSERAGISVRSSAEQTLLTAFSSLVDAYQFDRAKEILSSEKYGEFISPESRRSMMASLKRAEQAGMTKVQNDHRRTYGFYKAKADFGQLTEDDYKEMATLVEDAKLYPDDLTGLRIRNEKRYEAIHEHELSVGRGVDAIAAGHYPTTEQERADQSAAFDEVARSIASARATGDDAKKTAATAAMVQVVRGAGETGYLPKSAAGYIHSGLASGDHDAIAEAVALADMVRSSFPADELKLSPRESAVVTGVKSELSRGVPPEAAVATVMARLPETRQEIEARQTDFMNRAPDPQELLDLAVETLAAPFAGAEGDAEDLAVQIGLIEETGALRRAARSGVLGPVGSLVSGATGIADLIASHGFLKEVDYGTVGALFQQRLAENVQAHFIETGNMRAATAGAIADLSHEFGFTVRGERVVLERWPVANTVPMPKGVGTDWYIEEMRRDLRNRKNEDGSRAFTDTQIENATLAPLSNTPYTRDPEGRLLPTYAIVHKDKYERALFGTIPPWMWNTGRLSMSSGVQYTDGNGVPMTFGARFEDTEFGKEYIAEQTKAREEAAKQEQRANERAIEKARTERTRRILDPGNLPAAMGAAEGSVPLDMFGPGL